jgi:hypothetical protein
MTVPEEARMTVPVAECMMDLAAEPTTDQEVVCIQGQIQGLIWRFIRLGLYLQENSKEEEEFEKQN